MKENALVNAQSRPFKLFNAQLAKNASEMMSWDLASLTPLQIRAKFKLFVDYYKQRVLYTRALVGGPEILKQNIRTDEVSFFIGSYFGLKRVTVYGWMSETEDHKPLTWERFSLLIQREWALCHPEETFSRLTEADSLRYLRVMDEPVPSRSKRKRPSQN